MWKPSSPMLMPFRADTVRYSVSRDIVQSVICDYTIVTRVSRGCVTCMQAAAKAQAEAEKRQKEEMSRRRSRLQASMAEVTGCTDKQVRG